MSGEFDADIIIVGAGISGLSAALAIYEREPNISILVLEGNERIGGRTLFAPLKIDNNDKKQTFDLGGQFISNQQIHLMTLLKKLDIPIVENFEKDGSTIGDFDQIYFSTDDPPIFGLIEEIHELKTFLAELEKLCDQVSLENPFSITESAKYDSITMEEFISTKLNYSLSQNFVRSVIKASCGILSSDISVLFYLTYCNSTEGVTMPYLRRNGGAKEFWIEGGAPVICDKIVNKIDVENVKINSSVSIIRRKSDKIILTTANENYCSRSVIIALPPKKLLEITFIPPLNESRTEILKNMFCRPIVKFVVTYLNAFWKELNYNGDIFCCNTNTKYPIVYCISISLDNSKALTGLLDVSPDRKKSSYKTEVLNQLATYFGNDALNPLDYVEKLWSNESKYDGCSVSYPAVKNMYSLHEIRRPIGRLFFAGAETATYWYGHMAGAAQAGYRAAIEVLYDIRPQILTIEDFAELKPKRNPVKIYANNANFTRDWIVLLFIVVTATYLITKVTLLVLSALRKFV